MARARPFSLVRRMLEDLEEMGSFASSPFATRRMFDDLEREVVWIPRIEITQHEDKLVVRADLPGIPQDKIEITAEGGALVIEGERTMPSDQVWTSELVHGRFRRAIALPETAELDKAQARYENGVLEIEIPAPTTQVQGRRIEIQTGQGTASTAQSTAESQNPSPIENQSTPDESAQAQEH